MKMNAQIEVRRCRPLLGAFVAIQAFGTDAGDLERAVEAAFLAIAQVHRLMSFHDPESEVSRMNLDVSQSGARSSMDMARLEIRAGIFSQH